MLLVPHKIVGDALSKLTKDSDQLPNVLCTDIHLPAYNGLIITRFANVLLVHDAQFM